MNNSRKIRIIKTGYKNNHITTHERHGLMDMDDGSQELRCIHIYPRQTYQTFEGFGCAVTESAGWVLSAMGTEKTDEILRLCFGPEGLNYSWIRTHIDSCDFSLGHYSSCVIREDEITVDEEVFGEHDERYIIPYLKQIKEITGNRLSLYFTPWSPPAWMKDNGNRNQGGRLLPEYRELWARYICRFLLMYKKNDLPAAMVGVQNEPAAAQLWDSCLYSSDEEHDFIRDHLYPQLIEHGLSDTVVSIWDHNRDRLFERVCEVYREDVRSMIGAAAFHWYSGDHFNSVAMVREKFPELLLVFSEGCIEYSEHDPEAQLSHAGQYAHNIISDLNSGANIWLDWNLTLTSDGGPNHVNNLCDAPILCNIREKDYELRLSYFYIGHFSKHILPGALRIGSSCYSPDLEVTAWKNQDNSTAVVIYNSSEEEHSFFLRMEGCISSLAIDDKSIMTVIIS